MAFHVACPITCRRICFCPLGFPRSLQNESSRNSFFNDVCKIDEFLRDPWGPRTRERNAATVQVAVPKVVPPPPPPVVVVLGDGGGGGGGGADTAEDAAAAVSAQTKRAALQRKAAAAMVAAEDYARRFESGDLVDASRDVVGEEQGLSNVNVMCRICFFGENEGSERARKMLSCKSCGKKYHRSCLRTWSQHRDLFHWSLWTCPSCRICEVCRRTGDPNKFMFCKRCDGAYHCYCQHPPHKNVSSGPYVCPKHTRCHSCGSNVPGNGLSVRWFLGYTCCDACGRLFVKGNYCPVCLKVYRDSESTPMVCCDVCQRWVHCQCDGISDEKYRQFQVDNNLQYKCATCRGECYQVKDLQDAVKELWRRKDKSERDLIVSLRAAAGLPTQEEIFSISPYSDDEDNDPMMLKNESGHSLKFSLKGLAEKSPKKTYDYGKKSSSNKKNVKKKGYQAPFSSKAEPPLSFEEHNDVRLSDNSFGDDKNGDAWSHKSEEPYKFPSPIAGSLSHTEGICSINQPGVVKHKFVDEVMVNDEGRASRIVKIKSNKPHGLDRGEDTGKHSSKSKTMKGNKLVILLGSRNRNATNSPRSDASSCQREQDVMTSNGSEETSPQRTSDKLMVDRHDGPAKFDDGKGDRVDHSSQSKVLKFSRREGNLIKLGKVRSEASDLNPKFGGNSADGYESVPPEQTQVLSGKSSGRSISAVGPVSEVPTLKGEKVYFRRQSESRPATCGESNDNSDAPTSQSLQKDSKPSLKLKFKKPQLGTWIPHGDEEKSSNSIKGQRSKRKRPSPLLEQTSFDEDDVAQRHQDNLMDEIMDANWILKKLGKDGIGKRVEVHQQSDNSWHKGVVSDIIEGTSTISVNLEDGRVKTLELGKQGVRFVPQKKRRSKT